MKMKTLMFRIILANGIAFSLACRESSDIASGHHRVLRVEYYPSGALKCKRIFVHGIKDGVHEGWWENGKKQFDYAFRMGAYQGEAKEWYRDGSPASRRHYEKGVETGLQQAWRENGTLYVNYEMREGKRYGILNSRLCYSVKNGEGVFREVH